MLEKLKKFTTKRRRETQQRGENPQAEGQGPALQREEEGAWSKTWGQPHQEGTRRKCPAEGCNRHTNNTEKKWLQDSHTARLPTSRDRHRGGPHRARRGEGNSKNAILKDNEREMQQNSNFYKFQEEPRRTSSPRSRRRCQEESR